MGYKFLKGHKPYSKYSPEVKKQAIDLYKQGMSLKKIKKYLKAPGYGTLQNWMKKADILRSTSSQKTRDRAVRLYVDGLSLIEVCKRLNLPPSSVHRWICQANQQNKGLHEKIIRSVELVCQTCRGLFMVYPKRAAVAKYCSVKCSRIGQLGNKNPNWRGGISDEIHRLRTSSKYKQWRFSVFVRDKFTCVCCGQVGRKLNAHHILGFLKYPKLRYEKRNGVTLCVECHMRVHGRRIKAQKAV